MLKIEYDGEVKTPAEWSEYIGISLNCFYSRYKRFNGDMKKVINNPIKKETKYKLNGKSITCNEIAKLNGTVSARTINVWLNNGITVEEAINRKKQRTKRILGDGRKKPELCCSPDCDNCPYDDCKW